MKASIKSPIYKKAKIEILKNIPYISPCPYCNSLMKKDNANRYSSVTMDHVNPRSKGGGHEKTNLVPVCKFCNQRKSSKTKILLFRLNKPKLLENHEYDNLNKYIEVNNRVIILKEIKKLVIEDSFTEAIRVINNFKESASAIGFFDRLLYIIKRIVSSTEAILVQIKKVLTEIEARMRQANELLSELSQKVSHLNFSTYSLVATN